MAIVKKGIKSFTEYDVYELISTSIENIDEDTVKEVFKAYAELHMASIIHKRNLALPFIGKFQFDKKKGKRAGEEKRTLVKDKEGKINNVSIVVEEDEPSYCRTKLVVRRSVQDEVRELTKEICNG